MAACGGGVALYLALYQLGITTAVWEPFFGNGSERVLHSFISRLLPVPDAALGAAGYAAEFIGNLLGGDQRWRTMPRFVVGYGCLVALVALSGIILAFIQLFLIHAGCTLCLTSAAISIVIAALAAREVAAAFQTAKGKSL